MSRARGAERRTRKAEETDVELRSPVRDEVRENLSDHAAELETMAGEAGGDRDLRTLGQHVDDEMLVGRVREQACFHRERGSVRVGEITLDARAQDVLVVSMG